MSPSRGMRFVFAGIPVQVDPVFLVVSVVFGWVGLNSDATSPGGVGVVGGIGIWVVLVFISILAHEYGHALMFRRFGIESSIRLQGMGGATTPRAGSTLSPMRGVAVSLAGPFTGLLIGGGVVLAAQAVSPVLSGSPAQVALTDAFFINVIWSLFNLLPIVPLDGGHVLEGLLTRIGRPIAEDIAQAVSLLTLIPVSVVALQRGYIFVPMILGSFWFNGAQVWWQRRSMRGDRLLLTQLDAAVEAAQAGQWAGADETAHTALREARSAITRRRAWGLLALEAVSLQQPQRAWEVLQGAADQFGDLARGQLLLAAQRPADAVAPLYTAFRDNPGDEVGALIVTALIRAGEIQDAVSFAEGPQTVYLGRQTDFAAIEALGQREDAAAIVAWTERARLRGQRASGVTASSTPPGAPLQD